MSSITSLMNRLEFLRAIARGVTVELNGKT
jgi:hypothetical protein